MSIAAPVVTKQSKYNNNKTIDLRKLNAPTTSNAKQHSKRTLITHSFEQPHKSFRLPEALHIPELSPPTNHKAMFMESKIKKLLNTAHSQAYADSGTDIHITNPTTVTQLGLPRHRYASPVTIQFGDGSLKSATHFAFMGDILGEVAIIDSAPATLISIYSITTKGLSVILNDKRIKIVDDFTGRTTATA
jgi:hypothetical protein